MARLTSSRSARHSTVAVAAFGIGALVLSACGTPPDSASNADGANSDYIGCIVSDSGGFDDRSFNQSSYDGLKQTEKDLGIQVRKAHSSSKSDFVPNLNQMMQANCNMTVTVGFMLSDATKATAEANPEAKFTIIDDNQIDLPNVKPVIYDTAQAAFLAGYLAAGSSKTGKVGTFGGVKLPTVTIFMDGFYDGVQYYNQQKGQSVEVLGWNKETQQGAFANTFEIIQEGTKNAQNLINEGADIVMPVAGPLGTGAGDAVLAANRDGKDVKLIWVDSDGYETAPAYQSVILTSVLKKMKDAVEEVIKTDTEGQFDASPYIGTLANQGVDLAPYHDLADTVPAELSADVDQIKQDIIDGKITVNSVASPK
ncbi:BMP family ABC transporter substrate-binding protein [Acaricomes phytoseiuli]|uniref:BMP family lipoprotein n=1 Tax=Acaricomes phytoseiuli TaxID=291968 RepID=UPI002222E77E|nr:BMP family ABC transporter substrate-binding protein [Acaricomes phytoseiuli]MCW1248985.1 BMP family ABC transporter substrate-binding protein [Acaricomes phytoseiuli]